MMYLKNFVDDQACISNALESNSECLRIDFFCWSCCKNRKQLLTSQPFFCRGDSREREESCASAPGSEAARRRRGRGATLPWSRATRGSGVAAEEGGDPPPLHLTIRQEPLWMILSWVSYCSYSDCNIFWILLWLKLFLLVHQISRINALYVLLDCFFLS